MSHPDPELFVVRRPKGRRPPIVASLPHSGVHVPPAIGDRFTPEHCAWLRNTDWHLPELYDFLPQLGVTMIAATHTRYVVDLNRDPAGLLYGDFHRAVIARTTALAESIYSEPAAPRDHAAVVAAYHAPYHAALRRTLDETLATFGKVLLLDLHSFMGPTEHDVCIGDCRGTSCVPSTADGFERALQNGFDVSRNEPFAGGFITRQYGSPPRCEALQLELRYPTYLDCSHIDEPGRPVWIRNGSRRRSAGFGLRWRRPSLRTRPREPCLLVRSHCRRRHRSAAVTHQGPPVAAKHPSPGAQRPRELAKQDLAVVNREVDSLREQTEQRFE